MRDGGTEQEDLLPELATQRRHSPSSEARERLRHQITEACEPIAPFWPMKSFVHHNPIHGLEHLPFDSAIREAKHLLGGTGYLSNREYRQLYREGRITDAGVRRALQRVGPRIHTQTLVQLGLRQIDISEVLRSHLLFGFEALEGSLLTWTFGAGGATKRFQHDLPEESKQRIIERTRRVCQSSGRDSEESYLTDLWNSTLSALQLSESFAHDSHDQDDETALNVPPRTMRYLK